MAREQSSERVCYSKLGETGWLEPTPLTLNTSDYPRITTSRCGDSHSDVHIVWQECVSEANVITYMNIHGLAFGTPEQITSGNATAVHPAISADPTCNLDVVWQDNRESVFMEGVYYKEGIAPASGVDGFRFGSPARIVCTPNPFTGWATFRISSGTSGTLRIFDAAGRSVRALQVVDGAAGEIGWDGRNDAGEVLGSGVFFYRLDGATETGRVARLR